jgi:hypothetical protein
MPSLFWTGNRFDETTNRIRGLEAFCRRWQGVTSWSDFWSSLDFDFLSLQRDLPNPVVLERTETAHRISAAPVLKTYITNNVLYQHLSTINPSTTPARIRTIVEQKGSKGDREVVMPPNEPGRYSENTIRESAGFIQRFIEPLRTVVEKNQLPAATELVTLRTVVALVSTRSLPNNRLTVGPGQEQITRRSADSRVIDQQLTSRRTATGSSGTGDTSSASTNRQRIAGLTVLPFILAAARGEATPANGSADSFVRDSSVPIETRHLAKSAAKTTLPGADVRRGKTAHEVTRQYASIVPVQTVAASESRIKPGPERERVELAASSADREFAPTYVRPTPAAPAATSIPVEITSAVIGPMQKLTEPRSVESGVQSWTPADIQRLTDQVLRSLDQRVIAHRERMGRI